MWHAADGDLHAYLDGSLDVYSPGDAKRIRDHLESCAECQQRLAVESAVASSAREVLAGAAPSEIVAPPFEELRRRALGETRATSPVRRIPRAHLAWAATVILALGIGWGVGFRPTALRGPTMEEVSERGVAPAAPELERDAASEAAATAVTAPSGPSPATAAGASGAASADAPRELRASEPRTPDVQSALADARANVARVDSLASAVAASAPPGARGEAIAAPAASFQFRAADFTGEGVRALAARDSGVTMPPNAAAVAPTPASPLAERALGLDQSTVAQAPSAPLSLPGVPISSVEWVEVAPGVQGIRVVQGVDGVPVELYFVGVQLEAASAPVGRSAAAPSAGDARQTFPVTIPTAPPRAAARSGIMAAMASAAADSVTQPTPAQMSLPLPDGWRQRARPFRGGLMIIRAPLPEARLRQLLESASGPSR